MDPRDIKDIIAEIESEGSRFVSVHRPKYDTPFYTSGREAMRKQTEELIDQFEMESEDGGCTT